MIFCQKSHFWPFFGTFWSKFLKYCLNQKFEKKPVPRELYYHDFQAILVFLTQNYFFSLSQNFFYQKSDFLPFSPKNSIFSKI